jgi:AcrR family transcriptional regulator
MGDEAWPPDEQVFARLGAMPPRTSQDDAAESRPVGRPLDAGVDEAILGAAWRLLLKDGYSRMTIAGVAEEAGVGRPAIYRRYKDKSELVAAVVADKRAGAAPIDTGSTRGDMVAYLEFARRRYAVTLSGTLLVEGREHPELLKLFREGMILPTLREIAAALERGKQRGEVRADLDTDLAVHALLGCFMYHHIATGPPKKGWSERVVDMLWEGFAPASE